jgi:hypothetical protein
MMLERIEPHPCCDHLPILVYRCRHCQLLEKIARLEKVPSITSDERSRRTGSATASSLIAFIHKPAISARQEHGLPSDRGSRLRMVAFPMVRRTVLE